MSNSFEKVWYACYGSNILEERFNCYIQGGQPKGSQKSYDGCRNKNLPTAKEELFISSELYFAKRSKVWDEGGVAFIKNDFNKGIETLGRMYLITKEQLIDVARQETNTKEILNLDFDEAIRNGYYVFKKKPSWYGKLLYIGAQNDIPIFTFTSEEELTEYIKPSLNYLKPIINGIIETYGFDENTILEYLTCKNGILNNYNNNELLNIIRGKNT